MGTSDEPVMVPNRLPRAMLIFWLGRKCTAERAVRRVKASPSEVVLASAVVDASQPERGLKRLSRWSTPAEIPPVTI